MNTSLHLQVNNAKLHRMGTLLVPIFVTFIFFSFHHFLLSWFGVSFLDYSNFIQNLGTIEWAGVVFYPWAFFIVLIDNAIIFTIIFFVLYKNERIFPKNVGLVWSIGQEGFKQALSLNIKILTFLFLFVILALNFSQYFFGSEIINEITNLLHNWYRGRDMGIHPIAPISEEIIFRGIYCTLFIRYGFKWRDTILITGIGFGLIHLMNYQSHVLGYVIEFGFATVVGWFLGWIFYKTRTLVMPIIWHYAVNGFICFAVLRPDLFKRFADFVIV